MLIKVSFTIREIAKLLEVLDGLLNRDLNDVERKLLNSVRRELISTITKHTDNSPD